MKLFHFVDGKPVEVDAEELTRQWRDADRAAGPNETSRDWHPCPRGHACRAVPDAWRERYDWWVCPECRVYWSEPSPPRPAGGLTPFEWSIIRHHSCNSFEQHNYCLPDIWLNQMRVEDDQVGCEELGWFHLALMFDPLTKPRPDPAG